MNNKQHKKTGFTLIEILVAMAIFVVVAMGVSWILIRSTRSNAIIWEQLQTQSNGRRVIQNVVDDVRRANQSSIGGYPIEMADPTELVVFANIDADTLYERVHFWIDGTTLKKGVTKPSGTPLAYDVANEQVVDLATDVINTEPVFVYYGEDFTGSEAPLADPVREIDVRVVKVQLELERDPTASPEPLHVESTVHIRALKTN
jgi:prepilin-type N-terminal cleavage/methylation domain-containing protein